ncbi:MAG: hypothetical protein JWP22_4329 [Ramlibacter sp.]|jgi:hypothetical protein|nr:hypothetical protein [Ramlibacter sp.]MDB5915654.1 hypothetical protein [Ramlibacter sp.]
MSASQAHAFGAIAFQLAATLETYEKEVEGMLKCPFDADQYRRVSAHIDDMRLYASALPEVSVAWVEVLIRHFELTHHLWRVQQAGGAQQDQARLLDALTQALRHLSRKCAQLMPAA